MFLSAETQQNRQNHDQPQVLLAGWSCIATILTADGVRLFQAAVMDVPANVAPAS